MKDRQKRALPACLMAAGLLLCLLPGLWSLLSRQKAAQTLSAVEERAAKTDPADLDRILEQAKSWNAMLAGESAAGKLDSIQLLPYEEQMQVYGDGILGVLKIPKLNLRLPVYHGVDETVLSRGVGHLPSSSLPVGSSTGRSVLSAHRGLLQAELFTRLDELETGDLFLVENPAGLLAYEVFETQVIRPEEKEALAIRPGQDLITLMTCTPYGINDHRLLVTGRRIPYSSEDMRWSAQQQRASPSWREWIFRLWPWILVLLVTGTLCLSAVRKRKGTS